MYLANVKMVNTQTLCVTAGVKCCNGFHILFLVVNVTFKVLL